MAVTVTVQRGTKAIEAVQDKHANANYVFVQDGHLFVAVSPGGQVRDTIATYAPSGWQNAVVDQ